MQSPAPLLPGGWGWDEKFQHSSHAYKIHLININAALVERALL